MTTILVVDDRAVNREFISILLGYGGYNVAEAADGSAALNYTRSTPPDLIITDLLMPVMDGLELTRRLHADPATSHIPVVFYTATYRVHEARQLAMSCGVSMVLAKPSEPQVILDAVASLLSARADLKLPKPIQFAPDKASGPKLGLLGLQQRLAQALEPNDPEFSGLPAQLNGPRPEAAALVHSLSLRLAALLELDLTLGKERTPQRLLDLFCRASVDIMGCSYAAVVLATDDESPSVVSASGLSASACADLHGLDLAQGFFGELIRTRRPSYLSGAELPNAGLPAAHPKVNALLAVPVTVLPGSLGGVLYFADKINGSAFNDEDAQFAVTLSAQLAMSYGNLVLLRDVQKRSAELQSEIVERKRIGEVLRESEMRFRQLAEGIRTVFFLVDARTDQTLYVSPAYQDVWGRSCESLYLDPHSWADALHPDDRVRVLVSTETAQRNAGFEHQYRIIKPDGAVRWIWVRGAPISDESGEIYRIAATAEDITERKDQERKIARLSRIRAVTGGISSAMLRLRDRGELLQEACRVAATAGVFPLAWVASLDPQRKRFSIVCSHAEDAKAIELIEQALYQGLMEGNQPAYRAFRAIHPVILNNFANVALLPELRDELLRRGFCSGAAFPLYVNARVVAVLVLLASEEDFFDAEEVALLDWLTADLSFALEGIEKSARLDHLAYYDALTGLPNASLFRDQLDKFVQAARHDQSKVCVVVLDLEGFTRINDTLGRTIGDELLRQVGARLSQFLIEPYALGRIGSDTFAVASPRDGEFIATRLREQIFEALSEPFAIEEREVRISAQAGIALFPTDGEDGGQMFKNAESALKLAKSSGARYAYYSSQMNAQIAQRLALEEQLREAVRAEQFVLHYQPRIDMISGELIGAEALIRWQHPARGLVAPLEFIALAEQTGLIAAIGSWAINTVCGQQRAWLSAGLGTVPIAVNLSSLQFEAGDLLQTVRTALSTHQIPAAQLGLELTESAVMNDPDAAASTLQALRRLGVGLSLDDFGTGYSSLAHLKRFPFDSLKIDRSFVSEITSNAEDAAIATAIIAMAHGLKLKVVAEGVETQGQFNFLRAHGCDEMQGFLFGAAVCSADFEVQLRSSKRMTLPKPTEPGEHTLLLVDDEPGIRSALTRMLRRDGYRILSASSGAQGLELLALHAVQVIISDQRMPGMSGTDFLNTVKQMYPDTVRIILSGYTDLAAVTDAVNRGSVYKFLTKPWDDDLLREQVRDAFRRYRSGSAG